MLTFTSLSKRRSASEKPLPGPGISPNVPVSWWKQALRPLPRSGLGHYPKPRSLVDASKEHRELMIQYQYYYLTLPLMALPQNRGTIPPPPATSPLQSYTAAYSCFWSESILSSDLMIQYQYYCLGLPLMALPQNRRPTPPQKDYPPSSGNLAPTVLYHCILLLLVGVKTL